MKITTCFVFKSTAEAPCGCRYVTYTNETPPHISSDAGRKFPCEKHQDGTEDRPHWESLENAATWGGNREVQNFMETILGEKLSLLNARQGESGPEKTKDLETSRH